MIYPCHCSAGDVFVFLSGTVDKGVIGLAVACGILFVIFIVSMVILFINWRELKVLKAKRKEQGQQNDGYEVAFSLERL